MKKRNALTLVSAMFFSCSLLLAQPGNDDCSAATAVAVPSLTAGSTFAATAEDPDPGFCGTSINAPGVWYSVTGTGNTMTASTCNDAGYDTKISAYCQGCDTPTCVTGNDDFCGPRSEISWPSQAGAEYLILVHGFGGQSGDFELAMSDDGVPASDAVECVPPDSDGDGVPDISDACPNTVIPEASVPKGGPDNLGRNRFALVDGDGTFDTNAPRGRGPRRSFTIEDTAGCSCEQIIDELGAGMGHSFFGCSISLMEEWIASLPNG